MIFELRFDKEGLEAQAELKNKEIEDLQTKKRGDAFAILQLIREDDPDLLAKWETTQAPELGGEDDAGGG